MPLHDRDMQSVPGRDISPVSEKHIRGTLDVATLHGKYLIDDPQHGCESRLDRIEATDRNIAVQDLLENLSIGYEALAAFD